MYESMTVEGKAGPLSVRFIRSATPQSRGQLLFVHGAWSTSWYWEMYFMPWFSQAGFDCAAVNLRGHGESAGSMKNASISDYVADVEAVAKIMNNPIVVGHSMGGFVVQHYLQQNRPRAVVLLSSIPHTGIWATFLRGLKASPSRTLKTLLKYDLYPAIEDRDAARELLFSRSPNQTDKDEMLGQFGSESFKAFMGMLFNTIKKEPPVDIPCAIFGAERDNVVKPEEIYRMATFYGVEPIIFRQTSHMIPIEDSWQVAAQAMESWFRKI